MKTYILSCLVVIGIIGAIVFGLFVYSQKTSFFGTPNIQKSYRPTEQIALNTANQNQPQVTIPATKLPEFTVDIAAQKFSNLLNASEQQLKTLVQARLISEVYANEKPEVELTVDQKKHQLIVRPEDALHFKPGLYRLSLTLRTLEGDVNIDQDFTWGVIAVNTNKSIYKPGDVATIGMGILNDHGDTLCKTGLQTAKVWLTVTDPTGVTKEYSTTNNSIKDSGECSPNSVTNDPDFVAIYLIGQPGIYQMKVKAQIGDESREIQDYFKVEKAPAFDVERTSFPTRIYPKALYDVQFTVTANQDYSGTVEETTPAFFRLSKISNNGQQQTAGDFKKITWQVNLKKNQQVTFGYEISFPLVSPEFYLLGPIQIGNFKEARQWQIASDAMNTTSGLVAYEDNASQNTWSKTWSGTGYGTETAMASGGGTPTDSRWFKECSSPKTGEKLVAVLDNASSGTNDALFVYRWNGAAWQTADLTIVLNGNTTADGTRKMDIAYEQLSGDALFAFSDSASSSANQVHYYKRVNGAWDKTESLAGTATAPKNWVRLIPQRGTDNILLTTLNTNSFVGAMIWNGSTNTWGNEMPDNGSGETATSTITQEPVSGAWETQSGAAMLIYGTTGNNIVYKRFAGSSWSSETTALSGFTNDVAWLVADSNLDTSSNEIAVGTVELTAQVCRFAIWDGSTWSQGSTVTCRANIVEREIGVAWEFGNDRAMWVYVTSATPTQLTYRTYTGGIYGASTTVATAASGNILSVQLYSDSLSLGSIVLCAVDAAPNAQLDSREWDGTNWGSFSRIDTHASGIQGDTEAAEAYGFGFDRNLETVAGYRWFANSPGTNTSVDTDLSTLNTPYTLTSANQQFRLRLLLYYPDSLTAGNRSYKLQYVDPGSGSCDSVGGDGSPPNWTDVGSTVGTREILFFNNASVASASAITANAGLDPTYSGKTKVNETYNEQNTFTTNTTVPGDEVGLFDFSLIDNTTFDRIAQTFCFRVVRSSDLALQVAFYPTITTASIPDVLIKGGTKIQGGTLLQ